MSWFETLLAMLTVAVCAVLLVRLLLDRRRQARFDRWALHAWAGLRRGSAALWAALRYRRHAAREAQDVISRARRPRVDAEVDGNVVTPRSFKRPKKPHEPLH